MDFNKVLIPVTGAPVDDETIKLACKLTRKNKGKIWAVYIIGVKRVLPLDAEIETEIKKAESILDHLEEIGEVEGCEIITDLIQARDEAPAIVDEAIEQNTDLILLGVSYKRRFGQFTMGDVIPYLLKNAPCRVILYHEPAEQD